MPQIIPCQKVLDNFFICVILASPFTQLKETQMELKLTMDEAKKILLEWARAKFGDEFNTVSEGGYTYNKDFTFLKVEGNDEAQ